MAYCRKCGNEIKEDAKFCPKCGTKTDVGYVAQQQALQQQTYQPQTESVVDELVYEELAVGWQILSVLIPLAGIIIYFNNWELSPYKAHSAIVCACWGVVAELVLRIIIWGF